MIQVIHAQFSLECFEHSMKLHGLLQAAEALESEQENDWTKRSEQKVGR